MTGAAMSAIPLGPGGRGPAVAAVVISLLSLALSGAALLRPRAEVRQESSAGESISEDAQRRSPADVLAVRLAIFLALLVTFVVTQPLLWRAAFGEDPPGATTDLGALVSMVLTIASLVAGALGTVLYRTIDSRMKEISAKSERAMQNRLTRIDIVQWSNLGYFSWASYEQIWREQKYARDAPQRGGAFCAFLQSAIGMTEEALERCKLLPSDKRGDLEALARRNLAFHLATRGRREDADRAVKLLPPLDEADAGRFDIVETYCWVYYRLTEDEKKKLLFLEKLIAALEGDVPEDDRRAVKDRYAAVLGVELPTR